MTVKALKTKICGMALLSALSLVCSGSGSTEEPLKVLMIGNSFSLSCMTYIPDVARSMGLNLDICSMYIGGCSLERHVQNIKSGRPGFAPYAVKRSTPSDVKRANIPEMLKSGKWDVVAIQQKSDLSWRPETYSPHGDELVKTIRELAPGAEIVVQETWSYAPWDKRLASWNITSDEMYSRLRAAYGAFAGRYGFRTIPMGLAVQEWRKRLPVIYSDKSFGGDVVGGRNQPPSEQFVERGGKWMPNSDLYHLNGKGEYLQALVWTAFLFDADVTGCSFVPPGIDAGEAKLMQRIAVDVVSNRGAEYDAIPRTSTVECIPYSDNAECVLDIRTPVYKEGFPSIVWFHGGGLTKGARHFVPHIDDGIAQIAVEYRLLGKGAERGRDCIEDAAAATAWTLRHIHEYGGDSNKVFVAGMSAGGYLAMMTGMDPKYLLSHGLDNKSLAGIVAISGQATKHFNVRKFAGDKEPQYLPKIDELAPLAHVGPDIPPIICICGQPPYEWKCRSEENRLLIASCNALGHPDAKFVELGFCDHSRAYKAALPYLEMFVLERSKGE